MASSDTDYDIGANKLHVIEWEHLDLTRFFPLALASSWSIRCALYPMSVVKSRLQLQRQDNVYTGMRHAFVDIVRKEGVGALYRGFWMTLPQLSASFLYSSVYERMRDVLSNRLGVTNTSLVSALAGGMAAPVAQMVFVPTDIIAQHMMVHNNADKFGASGSSAGVHHVLARDGLDGKRTLGLRVIGAVYKVDGLTGFYRGYLSAIALYIPSTMVFWSSYYQALKGLRQLRVEVSERKGETEARKEVDERLYFVDQAVAGSIGGMAAAVMTNPLEMLRIRVQVHRTTYAETIRRLWKYEGLRVLTKGLSPRVVNNSLYSFFVMLAYETVKKLSVLPEFQEKVVW